MGSRIAADQGPGLDQGVGLHCSEQRQKNEHIPATNHQSNPLYDILTPTEWFLASKKDLLRTRRSGRDHLLQYPESLFPRHLRHILQHV